LVLLGHAAAKCTACAENFRHQELAAEFLGYRTNLCPHCRADLTESMRGHIYRCAMLPEEVRQRARKARDVFSKLIKQAHQEADRSDGLMREAEAADPRVARDDAAYHLGSLTRAGSDSATRARS